jgi:dTDP-glucose 4,6-dehydratase
MRVLVTGGAGFIGSAACRFLVAGAGWTILNLDKLTYAASQESLAEIAAHPRYQFIHGDVCDEDLVRRLLAEFSPEAILNLAAESHVDRSIVNASDFIQTNVAGTHSLLEAALRFWQRLSRAGKARFRFLHVSTDEVFGELGESGRFTEASPYAPRSPYSASKAASDHLVRAWGATHNLPVLVSNCSNNYGPYQFPEKLIPLTLLNALEGRRVGVYGDGAHVRDWLHVDDHVAALKLLLEHGEPGSSYLVGGRSERRNIDVVRAICDLLDELAPSAAIGPRSALIDFVPDRPGHDRR